MAVAAARHRTSTSCWPVASAMCCPGRFQQWAPLAPAELTATYNLVRAGSDIKLYYLGHKEKLKELIDQSGLPSYPGALYR